MQEMMFIILQFSPRSDSLPFTSKYPPHLWPNNLSLYALHP